MNQADGLPYSQACENNKQAILSVLRHRFAQVTQVLEIGSGTGQHALYFAEQLPHLTWQPSDQGAYLAPLCLRVSLAAHLDNLALPLTIDVMQPWPCKAQQFDALFSANTLHIMSKAMVEAMFEGISQHLALGGVCCLYGPFNYQQAYSSASNREFDTWLRTRDPLSGIRDIEWIIELAARAGMRLMADNEMPANNRLLQFLKEA